MNTVAAYTAGKIGQARSDLSYLQHKGAHFVPASVAGLILSKGDVQKAIAAGMAAMFGEIGGVIASATIASVASQTALLRRREKSPFLLDTYRNEKISYISSYHSIKFEELFVCAIKVLFVGTRDFA